jgi:hypothetical protein
MKPLIYFLRPCLVCPILHKPDFDLFIHTILFKNQGPQGRVVSTVVIYRPFVGISREVISFLINN